MLITSALPTDFFRLIQYTAHLGRCHYENRLVIRHSAKNREQIEHGFSAISGFIETNLSIPVLMLPYSLAIAPILLALLSPLFRSNRRISLPTVLFALAGAAADFLNALPQSVTELPAIRAILNFYRKFVPFFSIGMGWVIPIVLGLALGFVLYFCIKPGRRSKAARIP